MFGLTLRQNNVQVAPVQMTPITKEEEEGEAGIVNRFPGLLMPQMGA